MATSTQTPVAVVGLACRLPGDSNTPEQFWNFLINGKVAGTTPPCPRFNLNGHYDSTLRPWTMRSPGGMFINVDIKDVDAGFFGLSNIDATSMDPQQRQLLEVVYEGLENAGLTMESIKSKSFGCFVGSYSSDFSDMQNRNPEDRVPSCTVGCGRAMLSNRISHFLDITGPSMTIDTACSGSLISVDLACRYLDSGDADGAIVAGCNLYMSPEHNMDQAAMLSAASPTGRCWTFDARADGYVKAEAINCLILKRLDDALRDGDPIRAVIRGTSTNSDGRTPGIASPSAEAQAKAIRRAYKRAGITNMGDTAFLECHGTGTLAGDPIECRAASSVFSSTRFGNSVLHIGSVKSNIGHSEPAAGISGMLKAVLTVERGLIPGNPTFEIPNPKIDFRAQKLLASRATITWPHRMLRRASVNSFGYGGSNAHAIVENPSVLLPGYEPTFTSSYSSDTGELFSDEECNDRVRRLLIFSANDDVSLKASVNAYLRHLTNPAVRIKSADLAYTLARRRTRHFFRAYALSDGATFKANQVVYGKLLEPPRLGFVFTGQGAQWPQMGRQLLEKFPVATKMAQALDEALRSMTDGPSWSLISELSEPRSADHMRLPEFSQPLVTALQLCLLSVMRDWGIQPALVVGHSSGEIAAAVAAGRLSPEDGIKVAYLRGKAAKESRSRQAARLGMLAIGIGSEDSQRYLKSFPQVYIACINSPKSVTLSGLVRDLELIQEDIKADGHFARLLMVDMAYHSKYMKEVAENYRRLLLRHCPALSTVSQSPPSIGPQTTEFISTVYGGLYNRSLDIDYWVQNMVSPVLFDTAVKDIAVNCMPGCLIELGPSGALAGPIHQIKQALQADGHETLRVDYLAALSRDKDPTRPLYEVAGKMFFFGLDVEVTKVCDSTGETPGEDPKVVVDLPNYQWNHSVKYWHESQASKEWRFRSYPVHDLLGTKVLDTSWSSPTFRRTLRLKDVPWIRDHRIGRDTIFPAAGYVAMAVEAMFQAGKASNIEHLAGVERVAQASYRLRDIRLLRALVIEEDVDRHLYLELSPTQGPKDTWFRFKVSSLADDIWTENANGLVRFGLKAADPGSEKDMRPLQYPSPARHWYRSMSAVGFNFGPTFQNLSEIESVHGQRTSRARITFPDGHAHAKESKYVIHPSVFDTFFQAGTPSLYRGHRTEICEALVPKLIEEIVVGPTVDAGLESALAVTNSVFVTGRPDKTQNYKSNVLIYDEASKSCIAEVRGLHYAELHVPEAKEQTSRACHFMRASWKPDISLLRGDADLDALACTDNDAAVLSKGLRLPRMAAFLMSLLKHKVATPSVLDADLSQHTHERKCHDDCGKGGNSVDKDVEELLSYFTVFRRYIHSSRTPEIMEEAQRRLHTLPGIEFNIFDPSFSTEMLPEIDDKLDLVVLRISSTDDVGSVELALRSAWKSCSPSGFLVLVEQYSVFSQSRLDIESLLQSTGFSEQVKSSCDSAESDVTGHFATVRLCSPLTSSGEPQSKPFHFAIVDLSNSASQECATIIQSLKSLGWAGSLTELSKASAQPLQTPILLVDDPESPLLAKITEIEWESLRQVLNGGRKVLWLTAGSELSTPLPSNALIHGFTRSARGEEPSLNLKTLDLSCYDNACAASLISRIMETISCSYGESEALATMDNEYCERDGMLYISRVVADTDLVDMAHEDIRGAEPEEMWLRKNPKTVRLWCERPGSIGTLHFNEVAADQSPIDEGEVEVEIRAAGLNFKDVMTSLGVVPEDEHLLGLEGAGIITQVGSKVTSYHPGDRVLVHGKGCFANRCRVPMENILLLPDSMSFEDAATISIVYFTAVYTFMEIARLGQGQSVLIHSAAGGVGLACIQVCRYLGAELYVTAGSSEKRRFLAERCGIPSERIFSSRTVQFASDIRQLTGGRGVDFVLNFLTGDLLDESWRLLADNGMLLEIGKKDIVDKNALSMEPFDRNCSYHGIDISQPSILFNLPLVYRVLHKVQELLIAGHIKPISPKKTFPFSQIKEAMQYMRSGEHIGKIVISSGDAKDVLVPVRPAPRSLRLDPRATYLIVGGLSGICGSLTIYMARCGVRSLTVLSRRGVACDEISRRVLHDLSSLGVEVKMVKGDVSHAEDVKRIFQQSELPIRGIIQGAMVLRDKTIETMTRREFLEAIACKFQGTWNLHEAAAESTGEKLDFFTMLSSISGVIGSGGQANYAAGNGFQDAFARYRHSLGLAAHSINLGVVEDVGYMSKNQGLTERLQARSGLSSISERQLHEILKYSVLQQTVGLSKASASQMITGLPFPLPDDSPLLADARFSSLLVPQHSRTPEGGVKTGDGDESVGSFQAMVKSSVPAERLVSEAVKFLNRQLVKALGLATDVEESKPLSSYGIDSLAAVDLRNWIKVCIGVELTTLDVLNFSSLRALCTKIVGCLRDTPVATTPLKE